MTFEESVEINIAIKKVAREILVDCTKLKVTEENIQLIASKIKNCLDRVIDIDFYTS